MLVYLLHRIFVFLPVMFYTCYVTCNYLVLQVSAGWKHGDSVDEQAKTHPLLKPYKALSEKVHAHWYCTHTAAGISCLKRQIYRGAFEVDESCSNFTTCLRGRGRNTNVDCINKQRQSRVPDSFCFSDNKTRRKLVNNEYPCFSWPS